MNDSPVSSVRVSLSDRSYDIKLLSGSLNSASKVWQRLVDRMQPLSHAVVVCDANVHTHIAEKIAAKLADIGVRVSEIIVPPGEESKSVPQLDSLWARMLDARTDRKSVVVAVGGGVVGDLAGFAAATFARGLRLIQVPTTLLAMVDSSVGGKTGINLPAAKNIVGAFWQPASVIIDSDFLATLPDREYRSGLAEVVKYGVIMDPELFATLESQAGAILGRVPSAVQHVVAQSCRCKAEVVAEDERETGGRRAILNYGHTYAHAIEATTGYGTLLHGEAVSIGMAMAAELACHLKMIDRSLLQRQNQLLQTLGLPLTHPGLDPRRMWRAMQNDKKVEAGRLGFILPTRLGNVTRVEGVDVDSYLAAAESHLQHGTDS